MLTQPVSIQGSGPLKVLHYLFYPATDVPHLTMAHCLDLDILTSATDQAEAERSLNCVVRAMIAKCYEDGAFLYLCMHAEPKHWKKFYSCLRIEPLTHVFEFGDKVPCETKTVAFDIYRAIIGCPS